MAHVRAGPEPAGRRPVNGLALDKSCNGLAGKASVATQARYFMLQASAEHKNRSQGAAETGVREIATVQGLGRSSQRGQAWPHWRLGRAAELATLRFLFSAPVSAWPNEPPDCVGHRWASKVVCVGTVRARG